MALKLRLGVSQRVQRVRFLSAITTSALTACALKQKRR